VNSGAAWRARVVACPDPVLAVCRAGTVQPGVLLPPRLQPHQRDLQAGLPAAGEQVESAPVHPTSAGEPSRRALAYFGHGDPDSWCLLCRPRWRAVTGGTLNVPFCENRLSGRWQCPSARQQWGSRDGYWATGSSHTEFSLQNILFPKGFLVGALTVPPHHILLM